MYETRRQKLEKLKKLGIGNPKKHRQAKRQRPDRPKNALQLIKNPFAKKKEVKFEKVPEGQVTEQQAKEVVERMKTGTKGLDPFMKKQSLWERLTNKFKKNV